MLALLTLLAAAVAADSPLSIPLQPYGDGGARQLRVVVAGDTLPFLFDTGGGVTAISPALAARLGCTPAGRSTGYRMTGERLELPVCRDVALDVGGHRVVTDAVVLDLGGLKSGAEAGVDGMVSLHTFAGRALTVDLAANRLTVETPRSLAARTRGRTPVRARLATGLSGGELVAFVGVPTATTTLWLEWDTGHGATTFVAPHAAVALGIADTTPGHAEDATLAVGRETRAPIEVKRVIHDGVLSRATIERAEWTVDLATGRMWVGPMAPLLAPPATIARVASIASDPTGWYDVVLVVNGQRQPAYVHVTRDGDALAARIRFVGNDQTMVLRDVRARDGRLEFALPMRRTYPVSITFDGLGGAGTWGDATTGGAVEARKRG